MFNKGRPNDVKNERQNTDFNDIRPLNKYR